MASITRRELALLALAAAAGLGPSDLAERGNLHQELLDLADLHERRRRARFASTTTQTQLNDLQKNLRESFLDLIGGLPDPAGPPAVRKLGTIEAEGYRIEKLVYESLPGYLVPALLYRPQDQTQPAPAVLSPCGHSTVGKAATDYQILHVNLARRGYLVLSYDPVGQGERSQFWDATRRRSRFNLGCGEHAVMGNALYLLGSNLARYRIWDGMRGIDYLASLPEVDPTRIGCVGNSGGGTLTAYIAALDPRVAVAAICCYITTLPRRMRNRIQEDPSSDPEQDIYGFVSRGIDHAGLLALRVPRPTLIGSAQFDFFPIEGARESFAEAKSLYRVAGVGDRIAQVEAAEKHGLTRPLREGVYSWFDRWLARRDRPEVAVEIGFRPRPSEELLVCAAGQVNLSFHSLPLLTMALDQFSAQPRRAPKPLREILGIDLSRAKPTVVDRRQGARPVRTLIVCVNGNESNDWREEANTLEALEEAGHTVSIVDPRGTGSTRLDLKSRGGSYSDPLSGVEENLAYNAFLVGESLLGLRTSDVIASVRTLAARHRPERLVLCARRDAALVACLAAAVEPAIQAVATEEMLQSYLSLFSSNGYATNASIIQPGLLRDHGDIPEIVRSIGPRKVLVAAGVGQPLPPIDSVQISDHRFTSDVALLIDWLKA